MAEQARYTLWQERSDLDADDRVLAIGKTTAEAAEFVRTYDGAQPHISSQDYGSFRCFELRQYDAKSKLRLVISATVPSTDDFEADRRRAMEMIDVQTLARQGEFWQGRVSTDAEMSARLDKLGQARSIRALDREITTKLVDRLLEDGYCITCCLCEDVPSFKNSRARTGILKHLFDLEAAELQVHKNGETHGIRLIFGEAGWDVVADYSTDLAYLVDPIVDPYLPWNQADGDGDPGYSVFLLPSPAELDSGDPAAEKAVTDFFEKMGRLF